MKNEGPCQVLRWSYLGRIWGRVKMIAWIDILKGKRNTNGMECLKALVFENSDPALTSSMALDMFISLSFSI